MSASPEADMGGVDGAAGAMTPPRLRAGRAGLRALPAARAPRRGRDGRGLQGQELRRRGLREGPRHQAHPAQAGRAPDVRRHVRPRGEARGAPLARQHRAGLRPGPRRPRGQRPAQAAPSYFIAMEYVPGLDLATLLARCRRQKIERAPGHGRLHHRRGGQGPRPRPPPPRRAVAPARHRPPRHLPAEHPRSRGRAR